MLYSAPDLGASFGTTHATKNGHGRSRRGLKNTFKDRFTHIACRAHAAPMPFPCHAVPLMVYNVSFPFDLHSPAVSDSHMPCHAHVMLRPRRSSQDHSTARPSLDGRVVLWPWEERHGRSMARAWHGKCESDKVALCKSNGKDTLKPLAARHGRATGTACYVWIGLKNHIQKYAGCFVLNACGSEQGPLAGSVDSLLKLRDSYRAEI